MYIKILLNSLEFLYFHQETIACFSSIMHLCFLSWRSWILIGHITTTLLIFITIIFNISSHHQFFVYYCSKFDYTILCILLLSAWSHISILKCCIIARNCLHKNHINLFQCYSFFLHSKNSIWLIHCVIFFLFQFWLRERTEGCRVYSGLYLLFPLLSFKIYFLILNFDRNY